MTKNGLKIVFVMVSISIGVAASIMQFTKSNPGRTIFPSNRDKLSQMDFDIASKLLKISGDKLFGFRLLLKSDLEEDSLASFNEFRLGSNPGFICGDLIEDSEISCAAILVTEKWQDPKVVKVVIVSLIQESKLTQIYDVENFLFKENSQGKRLEPTYDGYLVPFKKQVIENRGAGLNYVTMTRNGVQLVFEGKSSMVFWYENGNISKYWISD